MAIYIVPFKDEHSILNKELPSEISLYSIYYKQKEGPLGFCIDDRSTLIFKSVVNGAIWYDREKQRFQDIDPISLENNVYKYRGLVIESDAHLKDEIETEKKRLLNKKINLILQRNGKPLHALQSTVFSNFHDDASAKYNTDSLCLLINKTNNFLLISHSQFGRYLIIPKESVFITRIISVCKNLNENVIEVDNIDLVPPW